MSEKKSRINKKVIIIACIIEAALIAAILFSIFYEDPTYKSYLSKGYEQLNNKQYEQAIETFGKALDIDSDGIEALIGQSDAYMGVKKYDQAISNLEKAKSLNSNDPAIYDKLINAYVQSENIGKANNVIIALIKTGLPTDEITSVQPAPSITPASKSSTKAISVTIDDNNGEDIYYTTNGEIPNANDKKYKKPIKLNLQGKYRIVALIIQDNGLIGFPATSDYTIKLEAADTNTNYDKYLGSWTDEETTLSVTNVNSDEISFNVSLSWVDEVIKTSSSGKAKSGILNFSYTDNWGNKGTGTLTFGKDAIAITIKETKSSSSVNPGFGNYSAALYR